MSEQDRPSDPPEPDGARRSGRIVWLVTSPRIPAGLLSWPAWDVLHRADQVLAAQDHPLAPYLAQAGIRVEPWPPGDRIQHVLRLTRSGAEVVWVAGDEDIGEVERLGPVLAGEAELGRTPPELEVVTGSYDPPGARLLDVVEVMDRLREGCPWDREQTHRSLVRYLLEETYETIEALETGSAEEIREELGDLVFQVFFHARMAEEDAEHPWSIDHLAGDVVDKLVRRHPHVFADVEAADAAEVASNWEQIKAGEKPRRSVVEGVPLALPALALADKVLGRLANGGSAPPEAAAPVGLPAEPSAEHVGTALLAVVTAARRAGVDPEQALRDAVRALIA